MKSSLVKVKVIQRKLLKDNRGWFLKTITGTEKNLPLYMGEMYFTSAKPGQFKGSHYHEIAQEWFTLISGKAILKLEDINTHETMEVELDSKNPITIYIPPLVAHVIVNAFEEDFILSAYTDVLFDPEDTIAYDLTWK